MQGYVKTFSEPIDKLDETINNYVNTYRQNNYINLTPIHISKELIKGNNYLRMPDRIRATVSFSCEKCTDEEILSIKEVKETSMKFYDNMNEITLRKSEIDDSIVFWFKDRYYDIYKLFSIHICKEQSRVYIYQQLNIFDDKNEDINSFIRTFKNSFELDFFISEYVTPKLEEFLL